jgi:small-conductance mechanosensitive channel
MFETISAALVQYIPNATVTLPMFGSFDLHKAVIATGLFIGLSLVFWFIRLVVLVRLESLALKTSKQFDDTVVAAIKSIRPWVYVFVALYASLQLYALSGTFDLIVSGILYTAFVWQGIQIATCFVRYIITNYIEKDEDGDGQIDPASVAAADMLTLISSIVLWVFGILFIFSNLGIEITSLIAGLGIGGIAVAFALQGVLGDLFASFSIYFDKPFRIGDFIIIGADSGTVEKIGIKSTRIRTLQGEELVVSNTELTTARVQNFKKMEERRISSQFGITYETSQEKVKQINGIVERIFVDIPAARLARVHFTTFADSALLFDLVYYIESPAYPDFLEAQQQFNFTLMERFAELGIEFAYPTQTLYTKVIS